MSIATMHFENGPVCHPSTNIAEHPSHVIQPTRIIDWAQTNRPEIVEELLSQAFAEVADESAHVASVMFHASTETWPRD